MDQSSDVLVGGDGADSVYLLFLTSDGTVLSEQQYSVGMGGFTATYIYGFGIGAGPIGDMNNDRISEVIIGNILSRTHTHMHSESDFVPYHTMYKHNYR